MSEYRDIPTFTDAAPLELNVHPLIVYVDEVEQEGWEGDTFDFVCCDCGLTHSVGIIHHVGSGAIRLCMRRNERSTAQYRRHKKGYLHNGNGKWRMIRNEK